MILGSLALLAFIPLVILFFLAIPIIIGVCVYNDANKRVDCSPWLWALVAALVPSYVGLVVYLIVRRDYPLKSVTSSAHDTASDTFDSDSQTSYYRQNYDDVAQPEKHTLPTWGKVLIIIGAVVIGICIVALVCSFIYPFCGFGVSSVFPHGGFSNGF